jgi:Nucleoside-diphosphate-sugar epimerases
MSDSVKRVFVTGAHGLVGKNIANCLSMEGYDLLVPTHAELDLLDFASVDRYIVKNKPDLVIHCAGKVGGIQANIREPVHFLIDNLEMGKNVIYSSYQNGVKRFLNMGSSCMYPRNAPNPLNEDLVLKGELEPTNEGYALAKIMSQRLCVYIHKEKTDFLYKTLVPCNLYGLYDKFDLSHAHMIPAAINKVVTAKNENAEVEIWGSGLVRREFMYAGDLADFVSYAIQKFDDMPDLLNVGTGKDYSVNEYYQAIANVIGFKGNFTHNLSKPEGMAQKLVDVSSLHEFGWESKTSLSEGIEKTYYYYLKLMRG